MESVKAEADNPTDPRVRRLMKNALYDMTWDGTTAHALLIAESEILRLRQIERVGKRRALRQTVQRRIIIGTAWACAVACALFTALMFVWAFQAALKPGGPDPRSDGAFVALFAALLTGVAAAIAFATASDSS